MSLLKLRRLESQNSPRFFGVEPSDIDEASLRAAALRQGGCRHVKRHGIGIAVPFNAGVMIHVKPSACREPQYSWHDRIGNDDGRDQTAALVVHFDQIAIGNIT